ncbi:hypothetical protein [Allosphingosinicella deserti]|uniref:Uncharacterized protein n=1 Tax=Allosphingosinicella deserti TaxID=2116704 RepID=A0A2P7QNZ2_9SPHN|nr:hypothetical protein [Sphingomonas deserti]PSJ39676.1 hypothetical protein C7I55_13875 [Sphingomonas deserti]
MSQIEQRGRIARVRRLQHGLAAATAAKASAHVQMLEGNDSRLGEMRRGMQANQGVTSGASLAGRGELAMRLEAARHSLTLTIQSARAASTLRERARLSARRDQESAEKLERSAARAARHQAETRRTARLRPRLRKSDGDAE